MTDPMPLGALSDALARVRDLSRPLVVSTPFGGMDAVSLGSYRGFYEQLAICASFESIGHNGLSVRGLGYLCAHAIGAPFCGYKGGSYTTTRATLVWVVLRNDLTSDVVVTGVEDDGDGAVVVLTGKAPF